MKAHEKTKSRKGNLEIKLESGNEGNLEKLKLMKKKGNPEKEIWKYNWKVVMKETWKN